MNRYFRTSRIFFKGALIIPVLYLTYIIFIVSAVALTANVSGEHAAELACTLITNICILFNICMEKIRSMHPVFGEKYKPDRITMSSDTKKINSTIYLLPYSRKEILQSYISSVIIQCIPLFISMTVFAAYSAVQIYDTKTCITGNLLFIFNTLLLPVKEQHPDKNDALHIFLNKFFIVLALILTVCTVTAIFGSENYIVSVLAGIISLLAEIRAVILLKKYHKKLLDTAAEWSVSGEPIGKEKKNA